MENRPPSGFKIGTDDDGPDPFVRSARQKYPTGSDARRLTIINRRLTFLSILLPLLMAALAWGSYFILKKEMASARSGSIKEIRTTVQALEEQVSALNEKFGKIESVVEAKEEPLKEAFLVFERANASMQEELEKIHSRLKQMDSGKADKKDYESLGKQLKSEQEAGLKKITEQLQAVNSAMEPFKSLPDHIKQLQEATAQSEKKQAEELAGLAGSLETVQGNINALTGELNKTKTEMVDVLSTTIDKNGLTRAMRNYAKEYKKEVDLLAKNLESKGRTIRSLRQEIKRLEKKVADLASKKTVIRNPGTAGSFTEQDLSN